VSVPSRELVGLLDAVLERPSVFESGERILFGHRGESLVFAASEQESAGEEAEGSQRPEERVPFGGAQVGEGLEFRPDDPFLLLVAQCAEGCFPRAWCGRFLLESRQSFVPVARVAQCDHAVGSFERRRGACDHRPGGVGEARRRDIGESVLDERAEAVGS